MSCPNPNSYSSSMLRLCLAYCYAGFVHAVTATVNSYDLNGCLAIDNHFAERYEHFLLCVNLYSTGLQKFIL